MITFQLDFTHNLYIIVTEEESNGSDSNATSDSDTVEREKEREKEKGNKQKFDTVGVIPDRTFEDLNFLSAKRHKRKYDHRLEDDDLDLIEENLGVKIKRKKFSRLKTVSSDEDDSDKEENNNDGADRDNVANEIFQGNVYDDAPPVNILVFLRY